MVYNRHKQMSIGAQKIYNILRKNGYRVTPEYEFKELRGKKGVPLRFDFAIIDDTGKIFLFEYDGEAHFQQIKFFQKTTSAFKAAQERDRIKNKFALMHNIPLYRIPYWEIDKVNTLSDIMQARFRVKNKYHNDFLKAP